MSEATRYTVGSLAEICGGRLVDPTAHGQTVIRHPQTLQDAEPDAITWVASAYHAKGLSTCQAGAIIGTEALLGGEPRGIIVEDPELAMAEVLACFWVPNEPPPPGVHPTAVIHARAELGDGVAVGAHVVIQAEASVGDRTVIRAGVTIGKGVRIGCDCYFQDRCVVYDRCEIGDRVVVHAGAVIGSDGFGYIFRDGRHRKLAHIGTVVIEDDVEIGANACIDRAKLGATRIGRGCKIDNLVQIAHNVQLDPLCVLAAQVGLSGSVRLGVGVFLAGQVGVRDGCKLGEGARCGAKSSVLRDVPAGQTVLGAPAYEKTKFLRDQARVSRLSKLFVEVAELKRRVAELDAATDSHGNR